MSSSAGLKSSVRSLSEIQAEIEQLCRERQRWWRAWGRGGLVALDDALQRREQLRALERRLAKAWLEKRLRLARSTAAWDEAALWRMLAQMERHEHELEAE